MMPSPLMRKEVSQRPNLRGMGSQTHRSVPSVSLLQFNMPAPPAMRVHPAELPPKQIRDGTHGSRPILFPTGSAGDRISATSKAALQAHMFWCRRTPTIRACKRPENTLNNHLAVEAFEVLVPSAPSPKATRLAHFRRMEGHKKVSPRHRLLSF